MSHIVQFSIDSRSCDKLIERIGQTIEYVNGVLVRQ